MNTDEFFKTVGLMRNAQKRYFRDRGHAELVAAKQLEADVDKALAAGIAHDQDAAQPKDQQLELKVMPFAAGEFKAELRSLLNKFSMEGGSDTPDFILAFFMCGALEVFHEAVRQRRAWYGRSDSE